MSGRREAEGLAAASGWCALMLLGAGLAFDSACYGLTVALGLIAVGLAVLVVLGFREMRS